MADNDAVAFAVESKAERAAEIIPGLRPSGGLPH
ncbi:hypothetical protein ABID08_000752 [Rhizobium binae]|uniref:Uncharacterized protein n=1 Tax=Rhizobium binae TaxID=1138190 RepID=A0ABV2MAB2_9HYPH